MSRPGYIFPKVSSAKAATTAVRFALCEVLLRDRTSQTTQSVPMNSIMQLSQQAFALIVLFVTICNTDYFFFYPRMQNRYHNYSRTVGTLNFVALRKLGPSFAFQVLLRIEVVNLCIIVTVNSRNLILFPFNPLYT